MTYRYLTDLAQVCRTSGLTVVELPGWKSRGRPASTGGFDPIGVLCHHTAGASNDRGYVEWMAYTGREADGLPAPLVQLALDRQGTVYVLAAGRANHAGESGGSGPIPKGDGNALLVGIEAMNTGTEGWTPTQYDAYARLCAALCAHYGWDASHVRAHRETSVTGKVDPSGATPGGPTFDMDRFRADVAHAMRDDNPNTEDDMPTPDDLWNAVVPEYDPNVKGDTRRAKVLLAQAHARAGKALEGVQDLERKVDRLIRLVEGIAK